MTHAPKGHRDPPRTHCRLEPHLKWTAFLRNKFKRNAYLPCTLYTRRAVPTTTRNFTLVEALLQTECAVRTGRKIASARP